MNLEILKILCPLYANEKDIDRDFINTQLKNDNLHHIFEK